MSSPEALARAILIVDDDAALQRMLAATLRGGGFRLLQAWSAQEALRLARQHRPALAFVDIGLGREDGVRLCATLKRDPETTAMRIVVLSGHDDPETRLRARRAGAERFFGKPFSPLALWHAVDEMLGP